jgi:TPR repeat protein
MVASCFGAIIGVSGYAYLSQSGTERGAAPKISASLNAVAAPAQEPRAGPDDAFRERISDQLHRADVPGTAVGYSPMAQPSAAAFFELASNQMNRRDAPRAEAADTIAPPSDDALLTQAFYKLGRGDGLGARAAYETVAQHGSALGAFGLAETYDPNVLARRRILGLKPDPSLARFWYERAAKLGNLEASKRLKRLAKPSQAVSSPRPISSSNTISSGSEVLRR